MALKLLPAAYKRLKDKYPPDEDGNYSQMYEEQRCNLIMTLVIAYYNTGTECEYLHNYQEAVSCYSKGQEWAFKTFGEKDPMSQTLKK